MGARTFFNGNVTQSNLASFRLMYFSDQIFPVLLRFSIRMSVTSTLFFHYINLCYSHCLFTKLTSYRPAFTVYPCARLEDIYVGNRYFEENYNYRMRKGNNYRCRMNFRNTPLLHRSLLTMIMFNHIYNELRKRSEGPVTDKEVYVN